MLLIATQLTIAIVAVVAFLAGYQHRRFVEMEEGERRGNDTGHILHRGQK